MEFPSFESIRLPSWVLVSSIFMGILFLMIAFNFAFDNQDGIHFEKYIDEHTHEFINEDPLSKAEFERRLFVMWLTTLDKNTLSELENKGNIIPACARFVIVNRRELLESDFDTSAFWFEFKNGAQIEYAKNGNITCYMESDEDSYMNLPIDCSDICPGGVEDFGVESVE